ncbi:MAG TPA: hypothetical protein PLL10_04455 [Elusimicrobiales bacterium]|nr:hypothetical protein [Elusimicrobiales bacterium]
MSKTILSDGDPQQGTEGSVITASLLNALNNHHHTGQDVDGAGALAYAADTGATANVYEIALSPALTAYITGMRLAFKTTRVNTAAATLNINGLGAKAIKKNVSGALDAGDIAAGKVIHVVYDGTNFQLLNHAVFASGRNTIINGILDLWQRCGSKQITGQDSQYVADRFKYTQSAGPTVTVSAATDVPTLAESGCKSAYSYKVNVDTADTDIGSTQYGMVRYHVEGLDIRRHMARNNTLSFWVRSNKTGYYNVAFQNGGHTRSRVESYNIAAAGVWQKVVIPCPIADESSGWNFGTGSGLEINFMLCCGSGIQTANTGWNSEDKWGKSGAEAQVNFYDTVNNYIEFALVQFETGDSATPFEMRSYDQELRLASRYGEPLEGVLPAGAGGSTTAVYFNVTFARKRIAPTPVYLAAAANYGVFDAAAGTYACDSITDTVGYRTVKSAQFVCTKAGGYFVNGHSYGLSCGTIAGGAGIFMDADF